MTDQDQTNYAEMSDKKKADDKCMGNRKIRTIVLSLVVVVFCVFALGFVFDQRDSAQEAVDKIEASNNAYNTGINLSNAHAIARGYKVAISGLFVTIAGCLLAILLFFVNAGDKLGRVTGVILAIGGGLYVFGFLTVGSSAIPLLKDTLLWDLLPEEQQNDFKASLAAKFGEALLPGATAVLLGIDVFIHLFNNEGFRLASNLGTLCAVAVLCAPCYYILTDKDSAGPLYNHSEGYPYVASGYVIIFWTALVYIVLWLCTCCTCDCKDTKCARMVVAVGLIIGGAVGSIGYYILASELKDHVDENDEITKETLYFIGYTVMLAGSTLMWSLDIAWDDDKEN